MPSFVKLSSWACSVACGVCLALAVLATPRTALADPPEDPPQDPGGGGEQYIICQFSCSPPRCGGDFCLCASGVNTCQDHRTNPSDCECYL